jgi:hypothetical protein
MSKSRKETAPGFNLISRGQKYSIQKRLLFEKLSLFRSDPSLLNSIEYYARTDATPEAFAAFVRFVEGKSVDVMPETVNYLRELAAEFGSDQLNRECEAFDHRSGNDSDRRPLSDWSTIQRLLKIEEDQHLVNRRLSIAERELKSVCERNVVLEREVTRLSTALSLAESRIQLFEGEQLYRRGCEYFFGTNGYGSCGEELSEIHGFALLKKSADLGHTDAQYRVGNCLSLGRGCHKNEPEGARYLRLSADGGNTFAVCRFGICLRDGIGVVKDEGRGFELIKQSAAARNAVGQNALGFCLELGRGTARDLRKAIENYELSMKQRNSWGQSNYGRSLVKGEWIAANPVEGAAIVKRAADRGLPIAQFNYACYLEEGNGVAQDRAEAAKYYRMAMESGDAKAKERYERCRR